MVDYKIGEAGMVYLSYATGFIPGGFTETCSSLATCQPFDSETNTNLEAGFKGQFLDNTVQVNGSLFYTEYEDLIRSQVVPFTDAFGRTTQETINVNAGKSNVTGLELETIWMPAQVSGLTLATQCAAGWTTSTTSSLLVDGSEPEMIWKDFSNKTYRSRRNWRGSAQVTYEQATRFGAFTYNALGQLPG